MRIKDYSRSITIPREDLCASSIYIGKSIPNINYCATGIITTNVMFAKGGIISISDNNIKEEKSHNEINTDMVDMIEHIWENSDGYNNI